ncbi:MAG: PIN domain-containing protein [Spirochaetales bacterium]|nr:PIN domain-containing protein [Spirochaetales bacterium]
MKYLLDTNACIGILKGKSSILRKRIENIKNADICIPSIVRYELLYGAYKSNQSEKTLEKLADFFSHFSSLAFDDITAKSAGKI